MSAPCKGEWYPQLHRREWLADLIVHGIGLVLGAVGCALLLANVSSVESPRIAVGLAIYSVGLMSMLFCSTLYNANRNPAIAHLFQRLDLAAIFVMIAGSYTPFMLSSVHEPIAWVVLAAVWAVAFLGVALNLIARWNAPRVYIGLYLLLGWAVVVVLDRLVREMSPEGVFFLAAGGVLYTVGVAFHVFKRLPFNSAIWHGFVVAGSACHFSAIFIDVVSA
ncbi:MAG: hemolysin III family protein [Alphaproteobacteria bacterium]|nr:hemolysin III family protein [Alphaproteobacteria bacterium]